MLTFTFLAQGADEPMKLKEGVSGIYLNGIIKNKKTQPTYLSLHSEKQFKMEQLPIRFKMHSVLADNAGHTSVFKAGDDSHTSAELEASILERATQLQVTNSTLVGEYFLR